MSKKLTLMLLLCVAVFCGCAREPGPVEAPAPTMVDQNENAIVEGCNAVQDAAEEYADRHGEYPGGMDSDITVDIQTCVVPESPDGRLPEGPVTEWVEIPSGTAGNILRMPIPIEHRAATRSLTCCPAGTSAGIRIPVRKRYR